MFSFAYIWAEIRRRRGRTILTALGLGVGVGLVAVVSALSAGLDKAQDEVLEPLTGVGTDLSVTRPIDLEGGPEGLSDEERRQLEEENGGARFGLRNRTEPGERFEDDNFTSTQLSFDAGEAERVAGLDGAADAAAGLTVTALHVSGRVPEEQQVQQFRGAPSDGAPQGPRNIDVESMTVTGVDTAKEGLGAISPGQVVDGEWFSDDPRRQAVLNTAYASREDLAVGDTVKIGGKKFDVVGLAQTPLGGQASDVYTELGVLQKLSDRKGRANTIYARATDTDAVAGLKRAIEGSIEGAEVTTASELADRVGGSLVDAKNLSSKLGTALTIVALVAAVLIAVLLTLSSVAKRVRELGTLKALGWPQRKVVGQVTGEALAQGALGGVVGAVLGIAGAAVLTAIGPELQASVAEAAVPTGRGGGPGVFVGGAFGQGQITSGSASVVLEAPTDFGLIVLAISLALLGGLLAGAAGGLRTARLRPADALRHID
jgi:ABC-type antimicrobial peptide transport system permease subunit